MKVLLLLIAVIGTTLYAADASTDVKKVLAGQTAAWNRGDLVAFVDGYADETVFIGSAIARGKSGVLDRYRKTYGTPEKRGTLEFTDLEVKPLGSDYASVIGRFHLTRTSAGGGDARGVFSLLFQKIGQDWKIILDHTS